MNEGSDDEEIVGTAVVDLTEGRYVGSSDGIIDGEKKQVGVSVGVDVGIFDKCIDGSIDGTPKGSNVDPDGSIVGKQEGE